jgi:hypothetical protein
MAQQNNNQMSPRQLDLMICKILREQTPVYNKTLGTFTGALGQTTRIKLSNVGLTTRIFLNVTVNTTVAVAAVNLNAKGLSAFAPRVTFSDFDGTLRTNISAYHLKVRNTLRKKYPKTFGETILTSVIDNTLNVAGAIPPYTNENFNGATGTNNQSFMVEIPVCKDFERGDYRGCINTQTTQGDVYASIDFCSLASVVSATLNDDTVFNSATGTVAINSISVEAIQEYFMIQNVGGVVTLPQYSTACVYALEGFTRTTDNISAGNEKMISLPNARVISGVYLSYMNNARLAGGTGLSVTDLTRLKLIANAGNYLKDLSAAVQYFMQRESAGVDINAGFYFYDFEPAPISTDVYGNCQIALTPSTTVTNPNIEMTFESLYMKGAALSGISQSG